VWWAHANDIGLNACTRFFEGTPWTCSTHLPAERLGKTSPHTRPAPLISHVRPRRTRENKAQYAPCAAALVRTAYDDERECRGELRDGRNGPWRGLRDLKHIHERVLYTRHRHRSDGKEGWREQTRRETGSQRACPVTACHHGTGAKGHANGTEKGPHDQDYSYHDSSSSEAHGWHGSLKGKNARLWRKPTASFRQM
jgi:hypothetical protein